MIGWLQNLDDDARRISLNQASLNSGINSKAIEKDWWVTLVLRLYVLDYLHQTNKYNYQGQYSDATIT